MMTTRSDGPYPSRSASSVIAVTLPPGSAGPPQPAPRGGGLGTSCAEVAAVGDVGLDRQDPGEAVGHQRSVHEQAVAAAPDVGEQAPVAVTRFGVALEDHGGARWQQGLG